MGCCFPKPMYTPSLPQHIIYIQEYVPPMPLPSGPIAPLPSAPIAPLPSAPPAPYYTSYYGSV